MRQIAAMATIRGGQVLITNRRRFDQRVARFGEGARVRVLVTLEGSEQSDAYRAYYRAVVCPAYAAHLVEQGEGDATANVAHERLAQMFLDLGPCPETGRPRRRSTAEDQMSAEEFRRYVDDQVLPYLLVDLGLDVEEPDPNRRSPRRRRQLQRQDEIASRGAVQP